MGREPFAKVGVMNTTGIWTDPQRCSGKPCINGTRFPMCQLLAELADERDLKEISEDFNIDYDKIKQAWMDLIEQVSLLKIDSQFIMSKGNDNYLGKESVSLLLRNLLTENRTPEKEAIHHDLSENALEGMLWDLASLLDRDWTNGPPENVEKAIRGGPE